MLTLTNSNNNESFFVFFNSEKSPSTSLITENASLITVPNCSSSGFDDCSFIPAPSDAVIMAFGETCGSIAYSGETAGSIAYSGGETTGSIASSVSSFSGSSCSNSSSSFSCCC